MSRMPQSSSARRWLVPCLAALVAAGACSKPAPPSPPAPMIERVEVPSPSEVTLTSELVAAGVPAQYRASFEGRELTRIVETRGEEALGEYEFRGARLLHYSGVALGGSGTIELRFDLQGALLSAKAASGEVPGEEIIAIRTRAQLLRSHALAQRARQEHQG